MLQGNDPFQEQYRWTRVFIYLMALALVLALFLSLNANYSESYNTVIIVFMFVYLALILFIFIGATALLQFQSKSFKQLRQRRSLVLSGQSFPRAEQQPVAPTKPIELPQRVRKNLRRGIPISAIILPILYCACQVVLLLPLLVPNPYILPDLVFESSSVFTMIAIFSLIYAALIPLISITAYYMLPALDIDDNGITAHYGQYHVSLAWQDIRYFAISNDKQIANPRAAVKTFVYEICDGKNIINWMPNTRAAVGYRVDHPNYNALAS